MSERPAAGAPGQKGERGEPGLPRPVARAVIILFLINLALIAVAYVIINHNVRASSAASAKAAAAAQQAAVAAQKAARADSAQQALCLSSNTARANEVDLWEFLIALGQPPKTAQGRRVLAQFVHHLHTVFAPRDCAHLGQSARAPARRPATEPAPPGPSASTGRPARAVRKEHLNG